MNCLEFVLDVFSSLKNNNDQNADFTYYNEFDGRNGDEFSEIVGRNGRSNLEYHVVHKESFGGEGMGDLVWCVFEITDLKTKQIKYVQFEGYYDSWSGESWEYDPHFCEPVEVTVIQWKPVK